MEIKTISNRLDNAKEFDAEVNDALAEGWALVKREVLRIDQPRRDIFFYSMLYAELVKLDPVEEPEADAVTWQEAVEVLRHACETARNCVERECPMHAWCDKALADPPSEWPTPEVVE